MWPISTRVNKPENDDPTIVEPIHRLLRRRNASYPSGPIGWLSRELRLMLGLRFSRTTHKIQHLLLRDRAIFVGIHRFEDAFVSGLELLQRDGSVTIAVHQGENHAHGKGLIIPPCPIIMPCFLHSWPIIPSAMHCRMQCRASPWPIMPVSSSSPGFCCTCSHCCIFAASSKSPQPLPPIAPETRANVTADSTKICSLMGKLLCGWHHKLPSLNSVGARLIPTNCRNWAAAHRRTGAIRRPSPLNFIL